MKVTLSTGQGRLFFVETSQALGSVGVVHGNRSGWIPIRTPPRLVNLFGLLVARDKLHQRLSEGVRSRLGICLPWGFWACLHAKL